METLNTTIILKIMSFLGRNDLLAFSETCVKMFRCRRRLPIYRTILTEDILRHPVLLDAEFRDKVRGDCSITVDGTTFLFRRDGSYAIFKDRVGTIVDIYEKSTFIHRGGVMVFSSKMKEDFKDLRTYTIYPEYDCETTIIEHESRPLVLFDEIIGPKFRVKILRCNYNDDTDLLEEVITIYPEVGLKLVAGLDDSRITNLRTGAVTGNTSELIREVIRDNDFWEYPNPWKGAISLRQSPGFIRY